MRDCSFVERIVFEGDRAVGVDVVRNGVRETIRAEQEVIVSAGAYQSPVLLMLSGIGLEEELAPFGIPVREQLPVGRNLQDHFMANLNFLSTEPALFGIFTKREGSSAAVRICPRLTSSSTSLRRSSTTRASPRRTTTATSSGQCS